MFNLLFAQLKNISTMTGVLEACDWSEERAEEVMLFAYSAVSRVIEENSAKNIDDFKKEVTDHLVSEFSENEINAIIELIDSIGDSPALLEGMMDHDC